MRQESKIAILAEIFLAFIVSARIFGLDDTAIVRLTLASLVDKCDISLNQMGTIFSEAVAASGKANDTASSMVTVDDEGTA